MTVIFTSLLIVAAKAIAVYLFILLAIRLFGKKELAQLSVVDLVFILLISNSVQNAMVGEDTTLAGGMAAATGLFVINYLFKLLLRKFPSLAKIIQGKEVMLIYKGKVLERNLESVGFTLQELQESVREHGVKDIEEVDLAILEVDGNISVLSDNYTNRSTKKLRRVQSSVRS
ncbi:MAG: DUF421 domain-containing protein [Bacteroidetes bacterium]|nr:DUF421 domain-containing protein [Bacteroidota bacterium]MBK8657396.1 DUF421 domain-containing protein [Bacteroidota bacterium]